MQYFPRKLQRKVDTYGRGPRRYLLENAIFGELYKNLGVIDQLFFWRTISKTEVDFILTGEQKWAFEAKFASDIRLKQPAGLRAFAKTYPDFNRVAVTNNRFATNEGISYLPGWMI